MYRHKLGELVRQQRQRLGLSIRAAAREAGVDRATWTGLEDGTRATQDRHYAGIESAMRWAPGSIHAITQGREPTIGPATPSSATGDAPADELTSSEQRLIDTLIELEVSPETIARAVREHRARRVHKHADTRIRRASESDTN